MITLRWQIDNIKFLKYGKYDFLRNCYILDENMKNRGELLQNGETAFSL